MEMKKPVIAIVIVIVVVLTIVVFVLMGNNTENGTTEIKVNSEHSVLYDQGQNGFPKIEDGFIYWTDFEDDSIIQYEIATEDTVEHSLLDDMNYSLSEIYPSDDHIICKYLVSEGIIISTEYFIFDLNNNSIVKLDIDAWGISFDYPYIVYHTLGLADENLFLYNILTNTTELIEHTSWGEISGDYVVYSHDKKAHIYKISTKSDIVVMESDKTNIEIDISDNKCVILDTKDTGPEAKTDIYTYNVVSKDLKKVRTINEWVIHQEFDGRYLFWAKGGSSEDVKVIDTESNARGTVASGQWIATLAYGTFSAENKIVVWPSNFDIHMGRIVD